MSPVDQLLTGLQGWPVYVVIGILAFSESAAFVGLVVPGETAMALGGVMAGTGRADLGVLLAVAVGGSIVGDLAGYAMGRAGGPRLRASRAGRWLGEGRWQRSEQLVADRGALAVFCGRWVGILRAVVPLVAGMSRMSITRFMVWNALGAASWASTVVLVGYGAGDSFERVEGWIGTSAGALVAVGVLIALVVAGHRWHERQRARRTKRLVRSGPALVTTPRPRTPSSSESRTPPRAEPAAPWRDPAPRPGAQRVPALR